MTIEQCKLCEQECTPWFHINGHICQDCYLNSKHIIGTTISVMRGGAGGESIFNRWINVKDRLPDNDKKVLVWQVYHDELASGPRIMRYKYETWEGPGFGEITHWMPLPEPPK